MADFFRVKCPICGSKPNLQQLENAKTGGNEVEIWIVKMGGKVVVEKEPGVFKKKGKGSAPGAIKYIDVTAQHPEMVEEYNQFFAERTVKFAQDSGLLKQGE